MPQQLTRVSFNMLLSCQDVPQKCQLPGSLTGKNRPPKDRVKLTALLSHMNMLKCLQLKLTVHRVKNTCIYVSV